MKIFAVTLASLLALAALGQEHQHGQTAAPRAAASECQSMLADMKAMDARLDDRTAAMNAADGEARVQAMAALIDELTRQRRCMREQLMPHRQASMPMSKCGGHAAHH